VWLHKGTTLKGIMLIFSSVVNKKFISQVELLFRHSLNSAYSHGLRNSDYLAHPRDLKWALF
jgi:hypothetical protein